jgi:hypothetical protein
MYIYIQYIAYIIYMYIYNIYIHIINVSTGYGTTYTKSPVETVRSWCSWHIESRHSPLRASVSSIGPRLRKKGPPGDEIAMLVYIYRFTMVHKSYVYTYYIYGYIWLWYIYTYSNPQQDTRVIIVLEWIVAK